jgi:hypothetical protein
LSFHCVLSKSKTKPLAIKGTLRSALMMENDQIDRGLRADLKNIDFIGGRQEFTPPEELDV